MRPAWPSRGVIVFRRAGRAASLHPQPQGRTATSAPPTPHPLTPGHGCASRSTPGGNASPTQAPRTQGPFAQRTEPPRCSHGPHRSRPPLPVQAETGVPRGSGGWDPALPCAPFRGIERTVLWPGRGPAAVGALRLGALSTAPCLPGTWGPGSQRFPRGPGSLVSSAGTAAATCPLLPVRTQTGPWVLAGWAGTGGTRPVLPGPAVELDCAPTAPPPAPHARGTAPGRRD